MNDIFGHDEPKKVLMLQMMVLTNLLLNHFMIFSLFTTWRNKISLITCLAVNFGMAHKTFGLQNFQEHYLDIFVYCLMGLIAGLFYYYIYNALVNLNMNQIQNMSRMMQENKVTKVYEEIMDNLREGIILFKENTT